VAEVKFRDGRKRKVRKILSPQAKTALKYKTPYEIRLPKGDIGKVDVKLYRRLSWKKEKELIKEVTLRTLFP